MKRAMARFIIFMKRVAASGAFRPNPAQVRLRGAVCFVYIKSKHVTGCGVFHKNNENNETRHWQWRAAIHIFKILRFSLLFLTILI
jgi:hypothetical protein